MNKPPQPTIQSVLQPWLSQIPMMQQTVLLTGIRGPDGLPKYGPTKYLLRWYRRCILLSSMEGEIIGDPLALGGGSFTGPSFEHRGIQFGSDGAPYWEEEMDKIVSNYIKGLDAIPHHFQLHLLHGIEILGYKHPVMRVRLWWFKVYVRLVEDMHLRPESMLAMDERLGDTYIGWKKHADSATIN